MKRRGEAGSAACCGGHASNDLGPFRGTWQRLEAGAPNPDFTLTIAAQGDRASGTFAEHTNGMSQTVAVTVEDGYVACALPTSDTEASPSATPGASSIWCSPTAPSSRSGPTRAPTA